jgi:hypothetical protein
MTKSNFNKNSAPQNTPMQSYWGLRFLILFHFLALGLTYSANWRRSVIQDNALAWLQPYLIGGNWYQEMLPVEWVSDSIGQKTTRISIQTVDKPTSWTPALDSSKKGNDQARTERLLHVLTELAISEDTQGLTNVLKSIVLHLESDPVRPERLVGIRLERLSQPLAAPELESILYEASLARFPSGEFGFVPRIDSHRSVRSLNSSREAP